MLDLSRRAFLRVGLGAAASAGFLPPAAAGTLPRGSGRAKAAIVLFMEGGPSQLDTFDLKPGQSTGGPFRPIETAAPGVQICEHLPRLAREMKHVSIVRSMTSGEGDHARGQYLLHTGHKPEPATTHPGLGSYVSRELGDPAAGLPNCITVALKAPVPGAAFLKPEHAPYAVEKPGEAIRNIRYAAGVDVLRFNERMDLLRTMEDEFEKAHAAPYVEGRRQAYRKADRLMHAPELRAFDLREEEDRVRDAYGRTPFGQGCLLARRLVERGVRFVEVGLGGWDTHSNNFEATQVLMETLDPAFATLIGDLRQRGLLEETLVVWTGEFGRTPRINPQNGRDHWPKGFSVAMAGGGIQGGRVVGATDASGFEIRERPVPVDDYAATIYHCLGIDVRKPTLNESGRPIRILNSGAPVRELL
jgi:hypothetical protein